MSGVGMVLMVLGVGLYLGGGLGRRAGRREAERRARAVPAPSLDGQLFAIARRLLEERDVHTALVARPMADEMRGPYGPVMVEVQPLADAPGPFIEIVFTELPAGDDDAS